MNARIQIASMIFMMVQAVLFGIGMVFVLTTPLAERAMTAIPAMVVATFIVSAPIAWFIAPRLMARYWRSRHLQGDFISG